MRDQTKEACRQIEVALLMSEEFKEKEAREELRNYMARWRRLLRSREDA